LRIREGTFDGGSDSVRVLTEAAAFARTGALLEGETR